MKFNPTQKLISFHLFIWSYHRCNFFPDAAFFSASACVHGSNVYNIYLLLVYTTRISRTSFIKQEEKYSGKRRRRKKKKAKPVFSLARDIVLRYQHSSHMAVLLLLYRCIFISGVLRICWHFVLAPSRGSFSSLCVLVYIYTRQREHEPRFFLYIYTCTPHIITCSIAWKMITQVEKFLLFSITSLRSTPRRDLVTVSSNSWRIMASS